MKKQKICIIGLGKVGSAFAFELFKAGFKINFIVDTNWNLLRKFKKLFKDTRIRKVISEECLSDSDLIFLTVQDSKLKQSIDEIKNLGMDLSGKIFIHTSGSLSSDVFKPLKLNKDDVASFHPIQTFNSISTKNEHLLKGIYFGVEGGTTAIKLLSGIATKLGSKVVIVPASKKPLYHLASVVASNFLVTNLNIISEILSNIGVKHTDAYNIYEGIIERTRKNISEKGIHNALTGPVDRNDIETIKTHIKYLKKNIPDLENYYKEVSKMTSKVALKKGSLNKKQFEELNRHLKN